jgi:hypothetical protein
MTGAYLVGLFKEHERVYIDPPEEWNEDPDYVWLMLRSMYGLPAAGRVWSETANAFMTSLEYDGLKFKPTASDPCVYTLRNKSGKLICVVDLHVDDFRHAGVPEAVAFVKAALKREWKCTSNDQMHRHLGVNYKWSADGESVEMSQHDKINDLLADFNMTDCKPMAVPIEKRLSKATKPITPEEAHFMRDKDYRAGVGALLWLCRITRPDLSWATVHLSQFVADPRPEHWRSLVTTLRYLKTTKHFVLRYSRTNGRGVMTASGFREPDRTRMETDSDWAPKEAEKRRSTSGYAFLMGGGAVSWRSKKQSCTAQSSCEAELISLASGGQEAVWMQRFLEELDLQSKGVPLEIAVDNTACEQIANNRVMSERTKHLDVKYFAVRDYIEKGKISVGRVSTSDNVSDIFTKPLTKLKFRQFRAGLGVGPTQIK